MARIVDTTPEFEEFARQSALELIVLREQNWKQRYQARHPEVFTAFFATQEQEARFLPKLVLQELTKIRDQVARAAPVMRELIEEVDGQARQVLDRPPSPDPVHVLLVDGFSTNGVVGRLGDDVAVFYCLEWFQSADGAQLLCAHEGAHAWHELALAEEPPGNDAAWMAFYEGVGIQASRAIVPGRPEREYFWYEYPGFEDWLPWCQEHRDELLEGFAALLYDPETPEAYFGAGTVNDQRRVGYFLADHLVGGLGLSLPELVTMSVEEGREAIRSALGAPEPPPPPPEPAEPTVETPPEATPETAETPPQPPEPPPEPATPS